MRLRILPIHTGERGQHYLVLDEVFTSPEDLTRLTRELRAVAPPGVHVLGFSSTVDLPDLDVPPEPEVPDEEHVTYAQQHVTYAQLGEQATYTLHVDVENARPLDMGKELRRVLREHSRITVRRT